MKKILFFAFVLTNFNLNAAELKFLSVDFPPYTYQTANGSAGAMHDVVVEISKRLGKPKTIEFVPWARARFEAENNPDVAIIPLARTLERENQYSWIIHILDDPYVLIALKNSKFNIQNIDEAKKLKIGTLSGSVADVLLKKMGFTNVESASSDVQNVKKLKIGRIDAWVAPLGCRGQYEKDGGLGQTDLRTGAELTILHEYLGASKSIDEKIIKEWQKEFLAMKKDGTYKNILQKYGFKALD